MAAGASHRLGRQQGWQQGACGASIRGWQQAELARSSWQQDWWQGWPLQHSHRRPAAGAAEGGDFPSPVTISRIFPSNQHQQQEGRGGAIPWPLLASAGPGVARDSLPCCHQQEGGANSLPLCHQQSGALPGRPLFPPFFADELCWTHNPYGRSPLLLSSIQTSSLPNSFPYDAGFRWNRRCLSRRVREWRSTTIDTR